MDALKNYLDNDETLNGLLVAELLDLHAVEAAEIIEEAYAEERVDPSVCGWWGDVRTELGVLGKGLAPDNFNIPTFPYGPIIAESNGNIGSKKNKRRKEKRKRKQQKQSRRQNRKKR
jgi:hypothetical protein